MVHFLGPTSCPVLAELTIQIFGTDFLLGKSENLELASSKEIVYLSENLLLGF